MKIPNSDKKLMHSLIETKKSTESPSLYGLLEKNLENVDNILQEHLTSKINLIPMIGLHLIESGGKRIRPLLTLASAALLGSNITKQTCNLAAAVELIHTATLLHDDVIDMATTRRGQVTANVQWGNTASVLVGDFMFSKAFQLMVDGGRLDILGILSKSAAIIAEGEVLQLSTLRDVKMSIETYFEIISAKTASLFASACQIGGLSVGCNEEDAQRLYQFGHKFGTAFQVIDDVLDYDQTAIGSGKIPGNDFKEGKITLPIILALQSGIERDFWYHVFEDGNHQMTIMFSKAVGILQSSGILSQCREITKKICQEARQHLYELPDNEFRWGLDALLTNNIDRVC